MPTAFFDTSAVAKNYHVEVGTREVGRFLALPEARSFISRLSIAEMQSVLARKVREGVIERGDFLLLRGRFLRDVARKQFRVIRTAGVHHQDAERLIRAYAMDRSSRTLDALQVAVVLDLPRRLGVDSFVCADRNLCAVVQPAGMSVVNPEETRIQSA